MENFRSPRYVERYEDQYFELETPLITVVGNNTSSKEGWISVCC